MVMSWNPNRLCVCSALSDVEELKVRMFDALDTRGDGVIDKDEFSDGLNVVADAFGISVESGEKEENKEKTSDEAKEEDGALSFLHAFTSSVAMILATEIGDKTFFIAAVLSMRNDRRAIFGGAILALIVMTILSSMMGLVLPALLPRQYTHLVGGVLFLYFGVRLLLDSRSMEDKVSDELSPFLRSGVIALRLPPLL
mmetsp:Transcript_40605/g.60851  ORF Transcript_40605/g.60851 Transcript_40605/m.60851 type:complete len:198 (-) Transcript_40605:232-825(-)